MGKNRLVCLCSMVSEKEILNALGKGADSTIKIQKITTAGTTCGKCLPQIDHMVEEYKKDKPTNAQLNLGL